MPPTPQQKKKRKPLGKPVWLEEADDPETAAPTQRDADRADELAAASLLILLLWRSKGLWNATRQRYIRNGREVSPSLVRVELEKVIFRAREAVKAVTRELIQGQITLREWQYAMVSELKPLHAITGGIAQGGKAELSPAALQRIGEATQGQYKFLNQRAEKVASGQQALNGTLENTAGLYANAGRGTYNDIKQREAEGRQYKYAERVRNAHESCDGCVDNEGFFTIDEVPPIGSQDCAFHCKCDIVFYMQLPGTEKLKTATYPGTRKGA